MKDIMLNFIKLWKQRRLWKQVKYLKSTRSFESLQEHKELIKKFERCIPDFIKQENLQYVAYHLAQEDSFSKTAQTYWTMAEKEQNMRMDEVRYHIKKLETDMDVIRHFIRTVILRK